MAKRLALCLGELKKDVNMPVLSQCGFLAVRVLPHKIPAIFKDIV